jgi:hypothetical protein
MDAGDLTLDGNAAAGRLAAIFRAEMTTAETTCDGCGAIAALGTLAVYQSPMGTILRCPGCDLALIRISEIRGRYRADLRGLRLLAFAG